MTNLQQPIIGLGGILATSQPSVSSASTVQSSVVNFTAPVGQIVPQLSAPVPQQTPITTEIPSQILQLIQEFETFLKNNEHLSNEISAHLYETAGLENVKKFLKNSEEILHRAKKPIEFCCRDSYLLKEQTRLDIKNAESLQRIQQASFGQYGHQLLLKYLLTVANDCERLVQMFAQKIAQYENFAINQKFCRGPVSVRDLLIELKRLDTIFNTTYSYVQRLHDSIQDLKDTFLYFRRTRFNDNKNYFSDNLSSKTFDQNDSDIFSRKNFSLEGPNPFERSNLHNFLEFAKKAKHQNSTGVSLESAENRLAFGQAHFSTPEYKAVAVGQLPSAVANVKPFHVAQPGLSSIATPSVVNHLTFSNAFSTSRGTTLSSQPISAVKPFGK